MIPLIILTCAVLAVEIPCFILYHREEDFYVLAAGILALVVELVWKGAT